jgi:hypothetical protein
MLAFVQHANRDTRSELMAIAAYFHPKGMTLDQFEETHNRLSAAGASNPAGG